MKANTVVDRSPNESLQQHFDRAAQRFGRNYHVKADFREREAVWDQAITRSLRAIPGDGVCLDLGCGEGTLSRSVASKSAPIVGIDQSEAMIALARTRAEESGLSVLTTYLQGALPLPPSTERSYADGVRLILCSSVLEYIEDYQAVLMQCFRMLQPGGRFILSVPNRSSVYRIAQRVGRFVLPLRSSYLKYQLHQFDDSTLTSLLEQLGYRVLERTFFALPSQSISEKVFGNYRGRLLATMLLIVVEKPRTPRHEIAFFTED